MNNVTTMINNIKARALSGNRVVTALSLFGVCLFFAILSIKSVMALILVIIGAVIYLTLLECVVMNPRPEEEALLAKLGVIDEE